MGGMSSGLMKMGNQLSATFGISAALENSGFGTLFRRRDRLSGGPAGAGGGDTFDANVYEPRLPSLGGSLERLRAQLFDIALLFAVYEKKKKQKLRHHHH